MLRVWLLLGLRGALAEAVTPVQKVITLLEDLKAEVEAGGTSEAGTYDEFACFCKTTTEAKSGAITGGHDTIDSLSTTIETNVASKAAKASELVERKKEQEAHELELEETTTRCMREALEFEATIADLTKALGSLDKAITALNNAKPAFLQGTMQQALQQASQSLMLADALGFGKNAKMDLPSVQALLQRRVDPDDASYKFRSNSIVSTLETVQTQFQTKKGEQENERDAAKIVCDDTKGSLTSLMGANSDAMDTLKQDIGGLETDIATDRESLTTAEGTLKDDQLYLKDLTQRCESSARDWDQRSSSRAEELQALSEALAILTEGKGGQKSVQELDAVNNRSVFLQPAVSTQTQTGRAVRRKVAPHASLAPNFLQAGATDSSHQSAEHAATFVRGEGLRLHSEMLASISGQMLAGPFDKVKQLIQHLIERLLAEAAQEATKKGFCDTEVGRAKQDRKHRFADITRFTSEVHELDLRKDELDQSVMELTEAIPGLYATLNQTTLLRAAEKEDNVQAIKLAKEGVEAVAEAITVLQVYYKKAGKANVLLQASPVDEDTQGAGFAGAYRGGQDSAKGIIGVLQVIKSDFDRTARQTAQAEKEAQAGFVEFERASKSDIAAKEMTLELDQQEFAIVGSKINKKLGDLASGQRLLDDALRTLEDLKPMCIDTGMTYSERAAKREEEIAALKHAVCILDPDGTEAECSGQ